jgi:hypothetical protein
MKPNKMDGERRPSVIMPNILGFLDSYIGLVTSYHDLSIPSFSSVPGMKPYDIIFIMGLGIFLPYV